MVIRNKMNKDIGFIAASLIGQLAASIIGGQLFYEKTIVPHLGEVKAVPITWWIGASSLIIITAIIFGWYSRSITRLIFSTIAGAIGICIYIYWAAVTYQPGYRNQPFATASPILFWTLGLFFMTLLVGILYSIPFFVRYLITRNTNRAKVS